MIINVRGVVVGSRNVQGGAYNFLLYCIFGTSLSLCMLELELYASRVGDSSNAVYLSSMGKV